MTTAFLPVIAQLFWEFRNLRISKKIIIIINKYINKKNNNNNQNILIQNMLCQADIMHGMLDNVVSNSMDGDADFSLLTAHLINYYFQRYFNSVQMLVDNNGKFIF